MTPDSESVLDRIEAAEKAQDEEELKFLVYTYASDLIAVVRAAEDVSMTERTGVLPDFAPLAVALVALTRDSDA